MTEERDLSQFILTSPWQLSDTPSMAEGAGRIRTGFCYSAAYGVFKHYMGILHDQPRWADYRVGGMGDMNVAGHTLRQTPITAQALVYDKDHFGLSDLEKEIMIAASTGHDLGEAVAGDVTYDLKVLNKRDLELVEAGEVVKMIDEVESVSQEEVRRLKEVYLRVTTSLEEDDVQKIMGVGELISEAVDWNRLRSLFGLYERYGYLMTALQIFVPVAFEDEGHCLNEEELIMAREWNRAELKNAFESGQEVPDPVRESILAKNVLLNQWSKIVAEARNGVPSAAALFKNPVTELLVTTADEIMQLNLDLSFFQE